MVSAIFSAVGMATAGPLGAALGGMLGRAVDQAVVGDPSRPFYAATSTYGETIPKIFGQARVGGTCVWAQAMQPDRSGSGGREAYVTSVAIVLSARPAARLGRIWADGKEIRDSSGDTVFPFEVRFYTGKGRAAPDPLIAGAEGAAAVSYPGLAYVVIEDFPLIYFRNRMPALSFEVLADEDGPKRWMAELAREAGIGSAFARSDEEGVAGYLAAQDSLLEEMKALSSIFGGKLLYQDGMPVWVTDEGVGQEAAIFNDYKSEGSIIQLNSSSVPASAIVNYIDVDRDYQEGSQYIERHPMGKRMQLSPSLVSSEAYAHALADRLLFRESGEAMTMQLTFPSQRARDIFPGRVLALNVEGDHWRVDECTLQASHLDVLLRKVAI